MSTDTRSSSPPAPLHQRLIGPVGRPPNRLRERPFWTTQLLVVSITVVHLVVEVLTQDVDHEVSGTFHHVPVLLYMVPIGYASLAYGLEGAALTGLWATALTTPNLLLWHREDFTWATELVFIGAVVSMGVLMAFPVEAERRERRRAEATSRRLTLLNDITSSTLTASLSTTLDGALQRLADLLDLQGVHVELADPTPREVASHARPAGEGSSDAGEVIAVHLTASLPDAPPVAGRLVASFPAGRAPTPEDRALLEGVADHLAVAIASERLRSREREHVRAYARRILQAQEQERRRIARDLHDESAQNLVVVSRDLASLAGSGAPGSREAIEQVRELVVETLTGLRRFSHDLRPPVLEDLGLAAALESLVDRMQDRGAVDIRLQVEGTARRLDDEAEVALFRIGQEALNNVLHHADATTAALHLRFGEDEVELEVRDDGRGFSVPISLADVTVEGSLGLTGMHERAALVGADLAITSALGEGTRVSVHVDLQRPSKQQSDR